MAANRGTDLNVAVCETERSPEVSVGNDLERGLAFGVEESEYI